MNAPGGDAPGGSAPEGSAPGGDAAPAPVTGPDVEVTAPLVAALLREQHPDLAHLPLGRTARGWDTVVVRLGDDLLVRVPHRAAAAAPVVVEQTWLGHLAPGLPLPVPVPLRVGVPGATHPYPWSVARWVPGTVAVADDGRPVPLDDLGTAADLGAFLAALHRPAPAAAPRSAVRGVPLAARAGLDRRNLAALPAGTPTAHLVQALRAGRAARAWPHPAVWVHGDLHPANVVVRDGRPAAVIDFGDLCAGDPATDLAVAWLLLPRRARPALWRAYAEGGARCDGALVVRARGWAASLASAFMAHASLDPRVAAVGVRTSLALAEDAAG